MSVRPRRRGDRRKFFRAFLARPQHTGAILPSSDELGEMMVGGLGLETARTIVELGPGTGVFTRLIAERCRPDAVVLAFEINDDFAAPLARDYPQFEVVHDSAEHMAEHLRRHGRTSVDCVVSSLPWAGFPEDLQKRLMGAVVSALAPGGRFATFAYIPAAWLPRGRNFRRLLEESFSRVIPTPVVWRNTPPAFVYRCVK